MSKKEISFLDNLKSVAQSVVPEGGSVWLYGSRARGDARSDSDWDLLILVHKDKITSNDEDEISYPFVLSGWKNAASVSPQLYTFDEWNRLKYTPYYQNVEHDKLQIL